ncbi:MAG: glycosyltransferase family 1 protein [Bacteroidota bacterium]
MKIAVNTRFLLPDRMEGIGYFTQEVCRRLVERCPEHEFLFCFDRPFDEKYIFGPNVTPKVVYPPARHPWLWYAWFEWGLPQVLAKWGAAVFFSPDGYCSLRSKVPTVMVTHDIAHLHYPEQIPRRVRNYYNKNVPRFIERADHVVTVSDFVKRDIMHHYGTEPSKLSVACNGVKPDFQPLSEIEQGKVRREYSDGQPYFFYLGAVHPRKNVPRLIEAYDTYREQGGSSAQLLIGGRLAWQTEKTRAAHKKARYFANIKFLGYVPSKDLPRLMASAKALVYPSLSEGFGVPVLEAFHAEVPVITSRVTSLPEVAGDAALLIDPLSVQSIAEAMLRLDRETDLPQILVEKGKLQRQHFSWDAATKVVANAIHGL